MKIKKYIFILSIGTLSFLTFFLSCAEMSDVLSNVNEGMDNSEAPLSKQQIISGLKSALKVGTKDAVNIVSKKGGFNNDPLIHIPFPPEAIKVKEKVEALGLQETVDKFVATMNEGAEKAANKATPIFVQAIKEMTIMDGLQILKGNDTAATHYLRAKTTQKLIQAFKPDVQNALQSVELTKYWNPIVNTYNKIPFTNKVNPDLNAYVTQRAVAGLFSKLKIEESKIRKDPKARVNSILKKVFGYYERNPEAK